MKRREFLLGGVATALQAERVDEAVALLQSHVKSGFLRAATLDVRSGSTTERKAFGEALDPDAVFLLASITKPMTVTAVMTCADRKQISISDPVQRYIPEFRGEGKDKVLIRHLLTHTSGLPDMPPNNEELRRRHAPLAEFVSSTCKTPLLFTPGSEVRYQSMGILLAAEIVQRVTKQGLPSYLKEHVFQPLAMNQTSLGLGGRPRSQMMQSQVGPATNWDWNSEYWRNLGSPWGGAHSTAGDIAKFLRYFAHPEARVLKRQSVQAMISEQTPGLKQRWGYGWSLDAPSLGSGCSAGTFGHSGSAGTLCWLDPKKDVSFVLLTTKPADQSTEPVLRPVSDLISERA